MYFEDIFHLGESSFISVTHIDWSEKRGEKEEEKKTGVLPQHARGFEINVTFQATVNELTC